MGVLNNYLPDWLPEDPSKNDAARQGLLAFAGSMLNSRGGFLNGLGNGVVAGGAGYQGALAQQQQQALRDEQFKQTRLENQKLQGQIDEPMQLAAILGGTGRPGAAPSITPRSALPRIGAAPAPAAGPTFDTGYAGAPQSMPAAPQPQQQAPAPAAQPADLYQTYLNYGDRLTQAGKPGAAKQYYDLAEKLKPKIKEQRALMVDGKRVMANVFEDGSTKVVDGFGPDAEKLTFQNTGGSTVALDPFTGKPVNTIKNTQSPDSVANNNTQMAVQREINARQAREAGGTDGLLPEETVQIMAQQYLAGDTSVMTNLGRGAQGAQNIIKIRNEIARQTKAAGKGGADLAAQNAEYFGTKAGQRTAGTRIANVEMASNEAQSLIPLAQQASAEVARSGLLPFGKSQIMFDNQTNDPKLRQFAAANNALVNVYARAISPSGVPTVADKEHAREMISTAMDHKSYMAVTEQMQKEITAARAAPQAVRKAFNSAVTGKGEHGAPTAIADLPKKAVPVVVQPYSDADKEARYQAFKRSQGK